MPKFPKNTSPFRMKGISPLKQGDTTHIPMEKHPGIKTSKPPQYPVKVDGKTTWLSEDKYKEWVKKNPR